MYAQMITVREARELVLKDLHHTEAEPVSIPESHLRVLAEDVVADEDMPAFDNSSMDGFALLSSDTRAASPASPVELLLVGEVAAGTAAEGTLLRGTAVRVMTGAPIPPGADAVIELEAVETRNGLVQVGVPVGVGKNIRRKGEELRTGSIVLHRGVVLRPAHLGLLVSLGKKRVAVTRKPKVAIVTTGNELVEDGEPLQPGKIRNSNGAALSGMILEAGAEPVNLGIARDEKLELMQKLKRGLEHDVLVTSGGVSVGAYDLVMSSLEQLGVEIRFWKVRIKPGMPVVYGVYRDEAQGRRVPVFGLPGNPVSSMVTYLQFVRPAIEKMLGKSGIGSLQLKALMTHGYVKKDGKRHFLRGILWNEDGELRVRTTGTQSSAALTSMASANCLIVIPEETMEVQGGEVVDVQVFQDGCGHYQGFGS